jgi:hypothetical protein
MKCQEQMGGRITYHDGKQVLVCPKHFSKERDRVRCSGEKGYLFESFWVNPDRLLCEWEDRVRRALA